MLETWALVELYERVRDSKPLIGRGDGGDLRLPVGSQHLLFPDLRVFPVGLLCPGERIWKGDL